MIAITKGTTSYRNTLRLADNEVEFTGTYLYEADGITSAMIWDDGLNNIRPMTQLEKDARDAPKIESDADKADLKNLATQAIADINAYLLIADTATNVQVRAEVKAIDLRCRAVIKALRRLV